MANGHADLGIFHQLHEQQGRLEKLGEPGIAGDLQALVDMLKAGKRLVFDGSDELFSCWRIEQGSAIYHAFPNEQGYTTLGAYMGQVPVVPVRVRRDNAHLLLVDPNVSIPQIMQKLGVEIDAAARGPFSHTEDEPDAPYWVTFDFGAYAGSQPTSRFESGIAPRRPARVLEGLFALLRHPDFFTRDRYFRLRLSGDRINDQVPYLYARDGKVRLGVCRGDGEPNSGHASVLT